MKLHRNSNKRLGRELREARPAPPAELESTVERLFADERDCAPRRVSGVRFGLAAAVTALLVSSVAVTGGMAAASSSVRHALADVASTVHVGTAARKSRTESTSPASDQYGRKASCAKTAAARRTAAIHAADATLKHALALANRHHATAVSNAKHRYAQATKSASKLAAALNAAQRAYLHERAVAFQQHGRLVGNANSRYSADMKKCPVS
jgi:hypothetical protein